MAEAAATPVAAPAAAAPTAAPTAVQTTTPVATPAVTPAAWTSNLTPEFQNYVTEKGFKDPASVLDAYQNLERLRGVPEERLVKLPDRHDDKDGWNSAYTKLGRPEKPEGYPVNPEDAKSDKAQVATVQKMFHEAGLSIRQAEILSNQMRDYSTAQKTDTDTKALAKRESEDSALRTKWGAATEQNTQVARQAAKTFGLTTEKIDAIEKALGFSGTMELFHNIGLKVGEPDFVTGNNPGNRIMTPDQASVKIKQLMSDPHFSKRYVEGEASANDEMTRLHQWANPSANE